MNIGRNAWKTGTLMYFGTSKHLCEGHHHCRLIAETSSPPRLRFPTPRVSLEVSSCTSREIVAGLCLMDPIQAIHQISPVVKYFGWAKFHQFDGAEKSKSGAVQVELRSMNDVADMSVSGGRQTTALANTQRTQDRLLPRNNPFGAPNISES